MMALAGAGERILNPSRRPTLPRLSAAGSGISSQSSFTAREGPVERSLSQTRSLAAGGSLLDCTDVSMSRAGHLNRLTREASDVVMDPLDQSRG